MNKLSHDEIGSFIDKNLIPIFEPMRNHDIYATLFATDGKILFLTTKSLESIIPDTSTTILDNSGYNSPPAGYITELTHKYNLSAENLLETCQKIYVLQMEAITKKKSISYIDLLPYKGQFRGYMVNLTPLFHPSGEVVALLMLSNLYHLFGISEFISLQTSAQKLDISSSSSKNNKIKFSKRQHEILFLICNDLSQAHVAQILNITRGTVSKTIMSQINPKLDILPGSDELIDKARKLGFHNRIPQSLWNRYIIVLN